MQNHHTPESQTPQSFSDILSSSLSQSEKLAAIHRRIAESGIDQKIEAEYPGFSAQVRNFQELTRTSIKNRLNELIAVPAKADAETRMLLESDYVSGDPDFKELLQKARDAHMDALAIEQANREYAELRAREDADLKAIDEREFDEEIRKANLRIANSIHELVDFLDRPKPGKRAKPTSEDLSGEERAEHFSLAITKGAKLLDINLPPKKMIIDDWFKEGDLGFIFAYRGAGKTWLTLSLCVALADGGKCGPWQVKGQWPTLYIDGEMSHDDDKSRILGLCNPIPENLYVLNHEVLFHDHEAVMNFGNPVDQAIITKICLEKGIKVLVLDNLGCLVSGVEENKADEWEKILPWLLTLRRQGISVIIVHHSGHDSTRMRGTVKREDSAAWVLRLDDQREDYSEAGARFISRFRKLRGQKPAPDYEWRFEPVCDRGVLVTFKEANRADVLLQWVKDGLTTCGAIAKEMGLSEGTISRLATKLIKEDKLTKTKDRHYAIP